MKTRYVIPVSIALIVPVLVWHALKPVAPTVTVPPARPTSAIRLVVPHYGPPTLKESQQMANLLLAATLIDSSGMFGTDPVFHDGSYTNIGSSFSPSSYMVFDLGGAHPVQYSEARVYFTGSSPGESVAVEGSNSSDMSSAVLLATVMAGSPGIASDLISDTGTYRYIRFTGSTYLAAEEVELFAKTSIWGKATSGRWRQQRRREAGG